MKENVQYKLSDQSDSVRYLADGPNKAVYVSGFFYVRLRMCAQYASMNEFTCSEHVS